MSKTKTGTSKTSRRQQVKANRKARHKITNSERATRSAQAGLAAADRIPRVSA